MTGNKENHTIVKNTKKKYLHYTLGSILVFESRQWEVKHAYLSTLEQPVSKKMKNTVNKIIMKIKWNAKIYTQFKRSRRKGRKIRWDKL